MKYEILIYIGHAGGIFSILVNIYLFIKLNIKKTFMDLTGLTVRKEMKAIMSGEGNSGKAFEYRKKHIRQNRNDTVLLVKDLAGEQASHVNVHDTEILHTDRKEESAIEETTVLIEKLPSVEKEIQNDFVLLKNITVVHTQESITGK